MHLRNTLYFIRNGTISQCTITAQTVCTQKACTHHLTYDVSIINPIEEQITGQTVINFKTALCHYMLDPSGLLMSRSRGNSATEC